MLRRLLGAASAAFLAATLLSATAMSSSALAPTEVPSTADRLHAGESTTTGLQSQSSNFLFLLQEGNAALVQLGISNTLEADVWETQLPNRKTGDERLSMQNDGNLVLSTLAGQQLWSSHTSGTGSNNTFVVQNDGNLVIYSGAHQVVWQSHTGPAILDRGSVLAPGHLLTYTPAGYTSRTRLIMQTNGDLVLYWGGRAVWTSHTNVPGSRLELLHNGNLVIYTPTNRPVWQSGTAGMWPAGLEVGAALGWIRPGVWYPSDRGYLILYDTNANQRWLRPVG